MRKCILWVVALIAIQGCSSDNLPAGRDALDDAEAEEIESSSLVIPKRTADPNSSDEKSLVLANSDFAFDLYARLRRTQGNLVLSPYSISTGLAMAYAGARDETEVQIGQAVRIPFSQDRTHVAFTAVREAVSAHAEEEGAKLHVANRLWGAQGCEFVPDFLQITHDNYGAELATIDWVQNRVQACHEINGWVEDETNGKISNLVSPEMFSPDAKLLLTCAIYFKAKWRHPFFIVATRQLPFRTSAQVAVDVPMMHFDDVVQAFRIAVTDDAQILELSYGVPPRTGMEFSMLVLLPRRDDGLPALERHLTVDNLNQWISRLEHDHIEVFLPRFKISRQFQVAPLLKQMGMNLAFEPGAADFTGMSRNGRLYLMDVAHAAVVSVNEEGTEAAAATRWLAAAVNDAEPILFRADHPFVFLIRHKPSGTILFLGRVVNPRG